MGRGDVGNGGVGGKFGLKFIQHFNGTQMTQMLRNADLNGLNYF